MDVCNNLGATSFIPDNFRTQDRDPCIFYQALVYIPQAKITLRGRGEVLPPLPTCDWAKCNGEEAKSKTSSDIDVFFFVWHAGKNARFFSHHTDYNL